MTTPKPSKPASKPKKAAVKPAEKTAAAQDAEAAEVKKKKTVSAVKKTAAKKPAVDGAKSASKRKAAPKKAVAEETGQKPEIPAHKVEISAAAPVAHKAEVHAPAAPAAQQPASPVHAAHPAAPHQIHQAAPKPAAVPPVTHKAEAHAPAAPAAQQPHAAAPASPAAQPAVPAAKPQQAQPAPVKPAAAPAPAQPAPATPVAQPAAAPQAAQPVKPAQPAAPPKPAKPVIKIIGQPTVRELAEKMGIKVTDFIKKLMTMGVYATINQRLESELAELVAGEMGFQLEIAQMFAENKLETVGKDADKPESLKPRPPVVTIMGHVDHGKTSLLDAIRKSDLCSLESGAITQHIGAYKVCHPKGDIVFLDTPGHEAFTAMRSRGAQATDIVILVVSATDGVMPQTVEAIDHAKAAGAPIIVAVNKIDLPGANPAKIRQELAQHGLLSEEWQGKSIFVDISAKKKLNIDKLLDMILLQAELMELKANPDKPGIATVVEAKRDSKRGVVATVLVKAGTLRVGDPFIVGSTYGKVRAMVDEHGVRLDGIKPSMPAEVLGFTGEPPLAGDMLHVVESEREARQIAEQRQRAAREATIAHQKHVTLLGLHSQVASRKLKTLQIILKADVQGSIQAIRDSLERLGNEEVEIKIIHSGAGNVNESDILLAKASDAVVLAFRVDTESNASFEADRAGIEIRSYDIIYSLLDQVRAAMEGLLEPDIVEVPTGKAEVRQAFSLSSGAIAGSFVLEGKMVRGADARVLRAGKPVHRGKISGLKRFKEDVKEVEKGFECGILVDGYRDIKPGDIVEPYEKKTVLRTMDGPK
ncbi:MAG: translation initiation factor IF-2 [Elusimicrobiales bacterium]